MRAYVLVVFFALLTVLQVVPGAGVRDARAATGPDGVAYSCLSNSYDAKPAGCTRQKAFEQCDALAAWYKSPAGGNKTGAVCYLYDTIYSGTWWSYRTRISSTQVYPGYFNGGACPAGTTWIEALHKCFDPQECLARNDDLGTAKDQPRPSLTTSRCVAGCEFAMQPGYSTFLVPASGSSAYRGVMKYTGNSCSPAPPTLPEGDPDDQKSPPPQECIPVAGQTMCVRGDGRWCASASTGRQICWRPGETGEKVDASTLQARNAGETPIAPSTPPPPGDQFTANGDPVVASITSGGVTIVSVTQNYTTGTGVNAGGTAPDQGMNSDGSPGTSDGISDSDGEDGGVQGGVDCDTPPVVTGDPVLANIVLQTWGTRCAVESANAVHSTGEIGVCSSPWTVEGPEDDANVAKLKGIRAEICGSDDDGNGIGDAYEGTAPTLAEGIASNDEPGDATSEQGFGTPVEADSANLDWGGWASFTRTCPVIQPIDLPGGYTVAYDLLPECDIAQALGYVLLLLASLFSLKVMAGGIQ